MSQSRRLGVCAAILLGLMLVAPPLPAQSQAPPAAPAVTTPATTTVPAATTTPASTTTPAKPLRAFCNESQTGTRLTDGSVTMAVKKNWQPVDGSFTFTIAPAAPLPADTRLIACLTWKRDGAQAVEAPVDISKAAANGAITVAVTVPRDFSIPSGWLQGDTDLFVVPLADLRIIGVSQGKSPTATAAYIAAERITSEVQGRTFSWEKDSGKVLHSEVMLPAGGDEKLLDPSELWNLVETTEHDLLKRYKEGMREFMAGRIQYAKHEVAALPRDSVITNSDQIELARRYVFREYVSKGVPAQFAIHIDDENNPHLHILVATRRLYKDKLHHLKARDLNPPMVRGLVTVKDYRHLRWMQMQNDYFAEKGYDLRVDPFGMTEQMHLGGAIKHGQNGETMVEELNREAGIASRQAIRENPGLILERLSQQYALFDQREISVSIFKAGFGAQEHQNILARVLADESIVRLRSSIDGSATQYFSTVKHHQATRQVMALAEEMSGKAGHAVDANLRSGVLQDRKNYDRAAVEYMTDAGDLKNLIGRAGTGKSTNLAVATEVWAEAGYRVFGVSPTNSVSADLRDAGITAATIDSRLYGFERANRLRSELATGVFSAKTNEELTSKIAWMKERAGRDLSETQKSLTAKTEAAVKQAQQRKKLTAEALKAQQDEIAALQEKSDMLSRTIAKYDRLAEIQSGQAPETLEYRSWRSTAIQNDIDRLELKATDVLVVDEAGMVGTRKMAGLVTEANRAGAKLVLVGDERQLEAIDAGAPFRDIIERFDSYALTDVYRQHNERDRETSKLLAESRGDRKKVEEAFARFEQDGRLHFEGTEKQAKAALVEAWFNARQSHGGTSLILAHTNQDVDQLNELARAKLVKAGLIEKGEAIPVSRSRNDTATHERHFAVGDQIRFRDTRKPAGIHNGDLATIRAIEGTKITAELIGSKKAIQFDASEFNAFGHGYAGTIYTGQGKTIDRTFLYYTSHWDNPTTYVALTRYRADAQVFANKKEIHDYRQMAYIASQATTKRSTASFVTDAELEAIVPEGWRYQSPAANTGPVHREWLSLPAESRQALEEVVTAHRAYLSATAAYVQEQGRQAKGRAEADKAAHTDDVAENFAKRRALFALKAAMNNARRLFTHAAMKAAAEEKVFRDAEHVYFAGMKAIRVGIKAVETRGLALLPFAAVEIAKHAPVLREGYHIYRTAAQIVSVGRMAWRTAKFTGKAAGFAAQATGLSEFLKRNPDPAADYTKRPATAAAIKPAPSQKPAQSWDATIEAIFRGENASGKVKPRHYADILSPQLYHDDDQFDRIAATEKASRLKQEIQSLVAGQNPNLQYVRALKEQFAAVQIELAAHAAKTAHVATTAAPPVPPSVVSQAVAPHRVTVPAAPANSEILVDIWGRSTAPEAIKAYVDSHGRTMQFKTDMESAIRKAYADPKAAAAALESLVASRGDIEAVIQIAKQPALIGNAKGSDAAAVKVSEAISAYYTHRRALAEGYTASVRDMLATEREWLPRMSHGYKLIALEFAAAKTDAERAAAFEKMKANPDYVKTSVAVVKYLEKLTAQMKRAGGREGTLEAADRMMKTAPHSVMSKSLKGAHMSMRVMGKAAKIATDLGIKVVGTGATAAVSWVPGLNIVVAGANLAIQGAKIAQTMAEKLDKGVDLGKGRGR